MFLPDLDGGGAQRGVVNLANALPRDRAQVTVAAARADGSATKWLSPDIDLVDLRARRLRWALAPLRRLVRKLRPTILLSAMADANAVATIATLGIGIRPKLILVETSSHRARGDIRGPRRHLIGWAYRHADAVVAVSEGLRQEFITDFGLDPAHTPLIHNPIDIERIAVMAQAAKSEPSPIMGTGPLILGIGRLHRSKGFDLLIRAFAMTANRSARLVLLGEGPDRAALLRLAAELDVADRVHLAGFVSDPERWLAHASIFVLSSRWEGFGNVIVEAMACGLPVLATDCPSGPADILRHGETGFLVPAENVPALASGIDKLLSDHELARRLGCAAKVACGRFSASVIGPRYMELFDKIDVPGRANQL